MKTKIFSIVQVLLGLFMVVLGLNKFLVFTPIPSPPGDAGPHLYRSDDVQRCRISRLRRPCRHRTSGLVPAAKFAVGIHLPTAIRGGFEGIKLQAATSTVLGEWKVAKFTKSEICT